ncbi:hypothetical protein ACFYRY_10305 [Streptomyces sp. NPDC005263]|uniref:hypothetical protein n=1 Tax=Streptomyces sp. NPDC005263 TaxID=3364711 RepID=UPI003696EE3E
MRGAPETAQDTDRAATQQEPSPTKTTGGTQVHEGRTGLIMHTYNAPVPVPYLTPKDLATDVRTMTSRLRDAPATPMTKNVAFYGGLGALTVAGALEWPVALAVAGATWLLREKGREAQTQRAESQEDRGSEPAEAARQSA